MQPAGHSHPYQYHTPPHSISAQTHGPSNPVADAWSSSWRRRPLSCDSSPVALSLGETATPSAGAPAPLHRDAPPLLSLLRSEGQDAAALVGTAGPALPLAARAGRASWLAKCHRCRPWPSGRAAAAAVAWVGRPCSPRAGLGLDPVPIRVVSV